MGSLSNPTSRGGRSGSPQEQDRGRSLENIDGLGVITIETSPHRKLQFAGTSVQCIAVSWPSRCKLWQMYY